MNEIPFSSKYLLNRKYFYVGFNSSVKSLGKYNIEYMYFEFCKKLRKYGIDLFLY